ncbi:phosphatase PAP2 family protein [Arenibacterium sp. LLYu02]|uniref:phosphatase PAP2 family protein n=1 Tax=Arenibacterium sp. LLYu02 TaxID=3404132 RepID=UPI003B20F5D3
MRVWLVLLLTFAVLPSLDLWVSALFYVPEKGGFFLDQNPNLQAMRQGIWSSFNLLVVLILIMGLHSLISSRPLLVPGRIWGYGLSLIVLGPFVLVNLGLKSNWGRARPAEILAFGGDAVFSPPWQIAQNCTSNCSFVSGEAASAATGAILVGLLLWHVVRPEKRRLLVVALVAFVVIAASLRVLKGRHFLSDVLWAIVLMGTLAQGLARVFRLGKALPQVTKAALVGDLRALWADITQALGLGLRRVSAVLRTLRRVILVAVGRTIRPILSGKSDLPEDR